MPLVKRKLDGPAPDPPKGMGFWEYVIVIAVFLGVIWSIY